MASLLVGGSLAFGASPGFADHSNDPPPPFNPNLPEDVCGLDFVLVLDRSGSIRQASADDEVKDAANGFLTAMAGTGSRAAVVSFGETASFDYPTGNPPVAPVLTADNLGDFTGAVNGISFPNSAATNWQDGLLKAKAVAASMDTPLVILVTDGEPNRYYEGGVPKGDGNGLENDALEAAVVVAEQIKAAGSHIFALGVGSVNSTGLKAVSGHDEWTDGVDFRIADWSKTTFDKLDDELRKIAVAACGGTITVTKKVDGKVFEGWSFSANAKQGSTDGDGVVQFDFDNEQSLQVTLTEEAREGYELDKIECDDPTTAVANGVKVTLGPEEAIACTFENVTLDADIDITKTASETTVLTGTNVTYTYLVTTGEGEVALSDVEVTDNKCEDVKYVSGNDGDEFLEIGETWIYECASVITEDTTNTATASGQPPVGGRVSAKATANVDVINPDVEIDKTGPAMAHEGDEIDFTITVTNTGDVTLTDLLVTDDLVPDWSETIAELLPGEDNSVSFQVPYTVPADSETVVNTAEVCPAPAERETDLLPECDDDQHEVDVIHPAITIDKTADPVAITDSGEVTYTYVVENTGDVTLTGIEVTDDVLGAIGSIASLAPGAKETLTKTVTVDLASPTRNVGTATGTDPLGKSVSDDDDETITVVAGQTETKDPDPVVTPASPVEPEVLGETVVQPEATLPRTGAQIAAMVLTGLALLTGGLGFRVAGRRRRNEES